MKEIIKQQREMFQKQNEMFQKYTEILMKQYNNIYENASTLVNSKQKGNTSNYGDTYRMLSLYENKILSLNAELQLLKKENTLLHEQLNLSVHKEIIFIKEDTQELKRAISIIKEEVHDIWNTLIE